MSPETSQPITVDGHRIRLTNLDKVLYPETGTTKGEVLDYLARIAPVLIPHARHRTATRKRWPDGVDGPVFFQKNADASTPSWVRTHRITHTSSTNDYVLVDDLATLTWLGQTATLEIHVPQWQVGRAGAHLAPDRMVLDLDPGEGAGLAECAEVARLARDILRGMGLDPLPVTSGSKGIHLYAALDGRQDTDQVSAVAHELARYLEAEHPDLVVSDMKKSIRAGKVLVDWSQNNGSKTTIAPYSLRGRPHPMVAAPRTWEELEDPQLRHLAYDEVLDRVARDGDLLAPLLGAHLAQLEPTPEHLARLEAYNAKRDPARTPEPFGSGEPRPEGAPPRFVIQEHHARRLHFDFRLEHEGVLVSWALPKGEPTDPKRNNLAVQTEDHPLAYGDFEGEIPKGEYGGGTVSIWDRGTYELEKWREGAEVIVTLHSDRRGSRRLALIRTGKADDEATWLIHRTKDQPGDPEQSAADEAAHDEARADLTGEADPADTADTADPADPADTADNGASPRRTADAGTRHRPAVDDEPARVAVPLHPMLASSATAGERRELTADGAAREPRWAFEMKWDGYRALAVVEAASDGGRRLRLLSRTGQDLTATYPELHVLADQVRGDLPVVLDGEIVAVDAAGRPDFRRLQRHTGPVDLMVFDVLQAGSRTLLRTPYDERRGVLDRVLGPAAPIHVPPAFDGDLEAASATAQRLRLEGVMAKRRDSTYTTGARSRLWLKFKRTRTQEVVVVGWRPLHAGEPRSDDRFVGGLLLAVPGPDGDLRYAGRVGTGFSDADRRAVATRLASLDRKSPPLEGVPRIDARYAHWVTPSLVGEVEAAEWTADPATDPEARLRAPSWRGWREDKRPDEVVVEI
ncbi:MAG: ATP-dependent DNA ligase [Cellulomonas sp. 73-92]|uniref:ATP-dependent DNA ligase n=1 Tax=Cellulomonas sp. 73-92 TaxID=1895740 RepID=UPI00092710AC|nr:ATP-dependent DNA ligase [Cellulomonas sp. 73-92]OJV82426.1 MAG: ATP-dependent DNA ligase [Cellulomonas sp. 73-92]